MSARIDEPCASIGVRMENVQLEHRHGWHESSVVLFKPCIHLFACTRPSVSNSVDRNDWLAYQHQSTAREQTRLDCGSFLCTSISFHPVFQTCLDCGSLSAHTHQYPALCSNTFGFRPCVCVQTSACSPLTKHVWIVVLVVYKHRLHPVKHVWNVDPCLRTRISFQHCVSNTYGLWFRVWVQASASCFLGQTRLDFGSLLCTSISLHPCLTHVLIMVPGAYASVFSAVFRMCLDCGSLSVHRHPSPALFKHV